MAKFKAKEKLELLAKIEGYSKTRDLLRDNKGGAFVPGICINDDCDVTADMMGRDTIHGWCNTCDEHSMMSCFKLSELT